MRPSSIAIQRSARHLATASRSWILLALLCSTPLAASALQYDVKQISDEGTLSRNPTIGGSDLIAWLSAGTSTPVSGQADIVVYQKGQRRTLDQPDGGQTSLRPLAQSNRLVWVTAFNNIVGDLGLSLAEVPSRDEGGAEEGRALFAATETADGQQVLTPVNTSNIVRAIVLTNADGTLNITNEIATFGTTNDIRRHPSGVDEIVLWSATTGTSTRLTHDHRNDYSPTLWSDQVTWQKAKGWPFGWEIFFLKDGAYKQLTTNFYYDMGPQVQGHEVVWYGWDGHDFEIYHYDQRTDVTTQITSNKYDDVSPRLWDGQVVWEGYLAAEADIYLYHEGRDTNGAPLLDKQGKPQRVISKISDNTDDDINARIWNGKVVWQGFDGDDFEIYYFDGEKTRKLTANNYDDTNPDIRDGLVVWQGYKDNWDSEIFAWDMTNDPVQVTDNEEEDRDPRTAEGRIVWQQDNEGKSRIFLATPKP